MAKEKIEKVFLSKEDINRMFGETKPQDTQSTITYCIYDGKRPLTTKQQAKEKVTCSCWTSGDGKSHVICYKCVAKKNTKEIDKTPSGFDIAAEYIKQATANELNRQRLMC